jgi:PiT family inorganic phosphate transporter
MPIETIFYLSSGLFLGWSLGANDAANVFGTAVGSRMIRFTTAAVICGVFLILGAVVSGAGAAHGLGRLGAVNALPGAFTVALSAAVTVYWMTRVLLPVSITQAIVGAIIGWNIFSQSITDVNALVRILGTWVACPILGAAIAAALYKLAAWFLTRAKLHLLRLDLYTRWGLVLAGALGSYSLGANNIANVMGVFVASSPFTDAQISSGLTFTSTHQLFLLGAIAIAVGVFTYSKGVMMTVGTKIMPLSPVGAWVVVVSHSLVLFLFSSVALQQFLVRHGLPPIPLIPVSSSQAVVGAVIGIGLLKGAKGVRQIRWKTLLRIASGWVSTPFLSAVLCFVLLFVMQNVFNEPVYREVQFVLSQPVLEKLERDGIEVDSLQALKDRTITSSLGFRNALREHVSLTGGEEQQVISTAELFPMVVGPNGLTRLSSVSLSSEQIDAVRRLSGRSFEHKWQLHEALAEESDAWEAIQSNREKLQEQIDTLGRILRDD